MAFKTCHGDKRTDPRRTQALTVVHDLFALYPFLRPDEGPILAGFADAAAAAPGDPDSRVLPGLVERGLVLVDEVERRRLVVEASAMRGYSWRDLLSDIGDSELARRTLAASAVRGSIVDRLLPPRRVLEHVEHEPQVVSTGGNALLFLLPAAGVWSIDDVADVGRAFADLEPMSRAWLASVNAFAEARLGPFHVERVRVLARHTAMRLPLEGLPRISSLLEDGCADAARDQELAADIAVKLLGKYFVHLQAEARSSSAFFAR